jgi:hypothetical protein
MRVAKVVKPAGPQACVPDDPLEGLAERVRMDRLAVLLRDDQATILIVRSPFVSLVVLADAVRAPAMVSSSRSITRALWLLGVDSITS